MATKPKLSKSTPFKGFPKETLKFLRDLRKNNTKKWFDANRDQYEEFYVAAGKAFVATVGMKLASVAPLIDVDPRINGSIYRINRDIRFSKDKTPYKEHLDFSLWEGEKKSSSSSLFLRITPEKVFIGAGFHMGCPEQIKSFRKAVADPSSGKELVSIIKKLEKKKLEVGGKHYKRFPKGYSNEGPAAEYLLYNSLNVMHTDKGTVACDDKFVTTCIKHWKSMLPLHSWLIRNVQK